MAGPFQTSTRPTQPGSFTDFTAQTTSSPAPSPGSVVAVSGTSDWGPYNVPTECVTYSDYLKTFGTSDTPLRRAVFQAFLGEGIPGKGGAGAVIVTRMAASGSIASASHVLSNTTPATAVTLTAKYPGTFGNGITLTTQAGYLSGTSQLVVLSGGAPVETYTYATTSLVGLVAQINATSRYVTAVLGADGVALATVSGVALSGGNDGSTLASGDYTNTSAALNTGPAFRVAAFANLTDPTISAAMVAWAQTLNRSGKRMTLVLGGALGESVNTAESAASGINDENVVRIGIGTITDFANITPGTNVDLSTAQFAPRVAGVIAARGEKKDLVFARFAGVRLNSDGPQPADVLAAPTFGLTVFSTDGRQDAPVRIAQGCTTFTTPTGANDVRNPLNYAGVNIFGVVRYVSIMQGFEMDLLTLQEQQDGNLGDLTVNDGTRRFLVGEGRKLMNQRIENLIVQPGSTVSIDTTTFGAPSDSDDFVAIKYGINFAPGLRQVFNTIQVGT